MNQTSLMRVEFKYENKAVPTASLAGTEASAMSRRHGATSHIARSSTTTETPRARPVYPRCRTTILTRTPQTSTSPNTDYLAESQDKIGDNTPRTGPCEIDSINGYHVSRIC